MSDDKKREGAKAIQFNDPVPGQTICWAIVFKVPVPAEGMSREEAEQISEAFSLKVLALVDEDEKVDVCDGGSESVIALQYALQGAQMIAAVKATRRARNN